MNYTPERGDIIRLDFDPSVGKEIDKLQRLALVLSPLAFNKSMGLAFVAPITNTIRNIPMEVSLPDKMETTGVIQPWQTRSYDWIERRAKFIEKLDAKSTQRVFDYVKLCIGG